MQSEPSRIGVKDRRMHITRATDSPCIAQAPGYCIDGLDDTLLGLSLGRTGAALAEGTNGQTVPAHVRTSLAVKSWPVSCRK